MYRTYTAFTMIELIAIMVIAGILGTSVVSTYSNYNKWLNINEELQSMVKILENARDYCMAKNEPFYLSINIHLVQSCMDYRNNNYINNDTSLKHQRIVYDVYKLS